MKLTNTIPDYMTDERFPIPQTEDEIVRAADVAIDSVILALSKEPVNKKGGNMPNEVMIKEKNPQEIMSLAIEKGADPQFLSKLLDVQERWEANVAKKAYVTAMAAFKQEAPAVLKKDELVNFETQKGRTYYKYANLGSIVQEISAILGKHDLSASWETSQNGSIITVACHVTHVAGHGESVTLSGPSDQSGNKNPIQAIGSTVTYLQRYTLLAALGLATGEDDDGRGGRAAATTQQESGTTDNQQSQQAASGTGPIISEAQAKRMFAISKAQGWSEEQRLELLGTFGYASSKEVTRADYEAICHEFEGEPR